jgi:polar amino acid transport system substrate-binding protein
MKHWSKLLLGLCLSWLAACALADDKTVTLTSLEWPPYTGRSLQDQGASVAVAKAAFKAMGYTLKVEFYPWSRAVDMAKNDPRVGGYFPEYYSDDVNKGFHLSAPMGSGPLGLAQRKGDNHNWNSIADLAKTKIGVVQDYVNTVELDGRIAKKQQLADVAIDDTKNLLKLAAGHIDLAVVDKNVFNYLMKTDPALKPYNGKLEMNGKLLEDKKLYICFKRTAEGEKLKQIFDEGLKKINVTAIMGQYLK